MVKQTQEQTRLVQKLLYASHRQTDRQTDRRTFNYDRCGSSLTLLGKSNLSLANRVYIISLKNFN